MGSTEFVSIRADKSMPIDEYNKILTRFWLANKSNETLKQEATSIVDGQHCTFFSMVCNKREYFNYCSLDTNHVDKTADESH